MFVKTLSRHIVRLAPVFCLTFLSIFWAYTSFSPESSFLYYYWLLGILNGEKGLPNIFVFFICTGSLICFVYRYAQYAVEITAQSWHVLRRSQRSVFALKVVVLPLCFASLAYTSCELLVVLGFDAWRATLAPLDLAYLTFVIAAYVIRTLVVIALIVLCNVVSYMTQHAIMGIIPAVVYSMGLAFDPYIRDELAAFILPWTHLIQSWSVDLPQQFSTLGFSAWYFNTASSVLYTAGFCIVSLLSLIYLVAHQDYC